MGSRCGLVPLENTDLMHLPCWGRATSRGHCEGEYAGVAGLNQLAELQRLEGADNHALRPATDSFPERTIGLVVPRYLPPHGFEVDVQVLPVLRRTESAKAGPRELSACPDHLKPLPRDAVEGSGDSLAGDTQPAPKVVIRPDGDAQAAVPEVSRLGTGDGFWIQVVKIKVSLLPPVRQDLVYEGATRNNHVRAAPVLPVLRIHASPKATSAVSAKMSSQKLQASGWNAPWPQLPPRRFLVGE